MTIQIMANLEVRLPSISRASVLVMKLLLIFATLQMTQVKCSAQISVKSLVRHKRRQAPAESQFLDAMVMNPDSLYGPTAAAAAATSHRTKRSAPNAAQSSQVANFVDACPSKMEVLTPYHATNSKGKLRTIVNSELMQQAIQVETCLRPTRATSGQQNRCNAQAECGCEQKYKWHRLLVLDPNEDQSGSRGLFMDWFLFPSNCVCRCKPGSSSRQFLRTISGAKRHIQTD